jgi:hypothetical protein
MTHAIQSDRFDSAKAPVYSDFRDRGRHAVPSDGIDIRPGSEQ